MSIEEHLMDLRKMMIRIVVILAVSFFISCSLGGLITEFLLQPLREALKSSVDGSIIYTGILDKVLSEIQVGFWSSIIISSPLWFREIWLFLKPGLHDHEIKAVRPFISVGFILFFLGVMFAYFVIFPIFFELLLGFGVKDVKAALSLKDYLVLSSKILVAFGLIFQVPNIMLIMGFMGLVTKYSLRSMRRYIYFGLAVGAAVFSPPDVVSMLTMWVPLVFLFEVGILAVAFIVHPYLEKRSAVVTS